MILNNFKNLAIDSNGICVLKKFISTNKNDKVKKDILNELVNNALEVVQSPFGNYAVQHAFQEWGFKTCESIVNAIINNIVSLSMQKYSSNVVEKCLELADKV
jgi:CRISPR/Cas system-associated endonuclease Cas3-HD